MSRIYEAWQKNPWLAFKVAADRIVDFVQERRLGIRTAGFIPVEFLVESPGDNHGYTPTSIRALRLIFNRIKIVPGSDVLLDYGCGMGRVLAIASEYPFKRVIGVEVSQNLARIARQNLARFRGARKCAEFQIWNGDAEEFHVPPDVTMFFFFNPFGGNVLLNVLAHLRDSLKEHPRPARIIFVNPHLFQRIAANQTWLQKIDSFSFEHECIIYKTQSADGP